MNIAESLAISKVIVVPEEILGSEFYTAITDYRSAKGFKSSSFIKSRSIDRNMNDQVLQRIIDTHPEINSKEQAVRWIQAHGMEAGNIAR